MEYIQIKEATTYDLSTVQHIGRETFIETFADSNTEEDMSKYLENSFSDSKLTDELNNPDSLFYIAWEDDKPVGYLKLNTGIAQTELQDQKALEIERIYVKSSHLGKKVGQLLYEKALDVALQKHNSYLWLGVWEKIRGQSDFMKRMGLLPLINIYSKWETMSRLIL
ncbi:GNAT family N-acetyltransferase [Pedobacter steynii]